MKKKMMIIITIILFIILIILTGLILKDLYSNNKKTQEKSIVTVDNWNLEKREHYYELSYSIEDTKISNGKYDIYIFDKDNNLLYNTLGVYFKSFEDGNFYMTHVVEYDISNINSIVISIANGKVSYNKDLTKDIEFIGEVTTKQTTIYVTTPKEEFSSTGE